MRHLLACALAACGSSRAKPEPAAPPPQPPVPADAAIDARVLDAFVLRDAALPDAPPRVFHNPAACPAAFRSGVTTCKAGTRCEYDAGYCTCAVAYPPPPCSGGAAMRPEPIPHKPLPPPPPPPPPSWQCNAWTRADGCPTQMPGIGQPCTEEGRGCNYGDCCFEIAACTNGHWTIQPGGCPP